MGASQKLQNSIQILIMFWLVYPIYPNSFLGDILRAILPFSSTTSILGIDSYLADLSFEYLSFFNQTENNYTLSRSSHVSAIAYWVECCLIADLLLFARPRSCSATRELDPRAQGFPNVT